MRPSRRPVRGWRVLAGIAVAAVILTAALWPESTEVDVVAVVRGPLQVTVDEEGETRVVYKQTASGQYEPTPVQTGVQGELYTQVTGGLQNGDQVVTFGSFFIDSEYKLKGTAEGGR